MNTLNLQSIYIEPKEKEDKMRIFCVSCEIEIKIQDSYVCNSCGHPVCSDCLKTENNSDKFFCVDCWQDPPFTYMRHSDDL